MLAIKVGIPKAIYCGKEERLGVPSPLYLPKRLHLIFAPTKQKKGG